MKDILKFIGLVIGLVLFMSIYTLPVIIILLVVKFLFF